MNLADVKILIPFLKSHGFYTQKKLGQNFLVSEKALNTIIEASRIEEGDEVLEIGPGPGALTQKLCETKAKHITALEIDLKVIPLLEKTVAEYKNITILPTNALEYQPEHSEYVLTANIPYYLTSPILKHYLSHTNKPKRAVLLVQKEVGEKICAKADDQTILSLEVGIYGKPSIVGLVPKTSFFPAPEVDSCILKIELFPECLIPEKYLKKFWWLVKMALHQRRKKLSNSLGKYDDIDTKKPLSKVLQEAGIDENRRPQTLSIDEWIKLCECVYT